MEGIKTAAKNKKARFNYHIEDKFEAGIVLKGTEVKAIREGKASIAEGFCQILDGELWLMEATIGKYSHEGYSTHKPTRKRKLLVHKKEIRRLTRKVEEKGYSLVPLHLYFKNGIAKLSVGIGKGKKMGDKRQAIKKRDMDREISRAMKR